MKPEANPIKTDSEPSPEYYRQYDRDRLAELGLGPQEIENLEVVEGAGATGLVYFIDRKGKKMAVKRGVNVDPDLNARREYAFLRLLKIRGGNKVAPEPLYYNLDQDILITERVEGEQVNEISNEDLVEIAKALALVHRPEFDRPGIPFQKREKSTQYDRLIDQIDFLSGWFREVGPLIRNESLGTEGDAYENLEKTLARLVGRSHEARASFNVSSFSLIHYDLNPGNIFKSKEGKILFLDWRQASIGDRAMDVAKFFYKNYLNEAQQDLFFDAYSGIVDDPQIRARVAIYYPLVRFTSLLWRLRFLNVDIKEHPEVAERADLALIKERLLGDYQYLTSLAGD